MGDLVDGHPSDEELEEYARLVLRVGAGFERGQDLVLWRSVEHVPFVRAFARVAYQEGARSVETLYSDDQLRRAEVLYGQEEFLGFTAPWEVAHVEDLDERRVALVNIFSPDFDATAGLPGERVAKAEKREFRQAIGRSTDANEIAWTVIA